MTLREQAEELLRAYTSTDSEWRHVVVQLLAALAASLADFHAAVDCEHAAIARAEAAEAELKAVAEASPQPDLAREWFEKGWSAGFQEALEPDLFPHRNRCEDAYLAASRQEQP
jgi:hypothetical protein